MYFYFESGTKIQKTIRNSSYKPCPKAIYVYTYSEHSVQIAVLVLSRYKRNRKSKRCNYHKWKR